MFCDEYDVLSLSSEDDENSCRELRSASLAPDRSEPKLWSELVETREDLPESMLSEKKEDM